MYSMTNSCKNVSAYDYIAPLSDYIPVLFNNPKGNSKNLSGAGQPSLPPVTHSDFCGSANKWYLIRVEIKGQQYKLYIDNKLIASHFYPSDSPVIKGGAGYYVGGGETVQIDDTRVWTLK
jgi:hypothetical protein